MPQRPLRRTILKFSLYSACLVLPKKLLGEFGWQPGDELIVRRHRTKHALILERLDAHVPAAPASTSEKSPSSKAVTEPSGLSHVTNDRHEELLPIPEID